jgi:hypothetical protein
MQPSDTSQFKSAASGADEAITPEIVLEILAAFRGLRYGSIVVTIHDSKEVQIEKNEKVRLQKKAGGETR